MKDSGTIVDMLNTTPVLSKTPPIRHDGLTDVEQSTWRRVLLHDSPAPATKLANQVLADLDARPVLNVDADCHLRFAIDSKSSADATRLLLATLVYVLLRDKRWGRVRACTSSECDAVFLDQSRNGSRRYCCRRCENRNAVAAHRRRRARTNRRLRNAERSAARDVVI